MGRVADSDALVAFVTNGNDVRAYVCDGSSDDHLTISEWFKGTLAGDGLDLASVSGAARLTAKVEATVAKGRVVRDDGIDLAFEATLDDSDAGFYLFKNFVGDQFYWAGWIVLPTGEQRGSLLLGTNATANATFDLRTITARLPGVGTVRPGKLIAANVTQGFGGCFPCP